MHELVNRFFFRDSPEQIAGILGIGDLTETARVNEVVMPEGVFSYAKTAVEATGQDFRERFAFINQDGTQTRLREQLVSMPFDLEIGAGFRFRENVLRYYFGNPDLIAFHTHPTSTSDFISREIGPERTIEIDGQGISPSQAADLISIFVPYFSSSDLKTFEFRSRTIPTALLGTTEGYLWIMRSKLSMPWLQDTKASREYAIAEKRIRKEAVDQVANGEELDKEDLTKQLRQALIKYCQARRLLLFQNKDYKDPLLERVV